jgi:hypothetical protein
VRTLRPVVVVVSSVLAVLILMVAGILFLPTLLTGPSQRQSEKDEREARAQMAQRIDTYAGQVVAHSVGPGGPSTGDLTKYGEPASLRYAPERAGDALTALWVMARAEIGGLLGPYVIYECYTINLHDLGTPTAGSQVTHLPDCTAVNSRFNALTPTPTISSGP